jgi:hypothetical protein
MLNRIPYQQCCILNIQFKHQAFAVGIHSA